MYICSTTDLIQDRVCQRQEAFGLLYSFYCLETLVDVISVLSVQHATEHKPRVMQLNSQPHVSGTLTKEEYNTMVGK